MVSCRELGELCSRRAGVERPRRSRWGHGLAIAVSGLIAALEDQESRRSFGSRAQPWSPAGDGGDRALDRGGDRRTGAEGSSPPRRSSLGRLSCPSAAPSPPRACGRAHDAAELFGFLDPSGDATPLVTLLSVPVPRFARRPRRHSGGSPTRQRRGRCRMLSTTTTSVRAAAAAALGEIGEGGSVEVLLEVAQRDAFEPARAAARSAARIDPAACERRRAPGRGPVPARRQPTWRRCERARGHRRRAVRRHLRLLHARQWRPDRAHRAGVGTVTAEKHAGRYLGLEDSSRRR